MKIFFDGDIFLHQKSGGISRVAFELIKGFNNKKNINKCFYRGLYIDNYPFKKEWFSEYYGIRKPNLSNTRFASFVNKIWMNLIYNHYSSSDVIYQSFFYRVPKKPRGPVVVYAHDMINELFTRNSKVANFKKKAFYKADLIIAVSDSTKNDICKIYPDINPDKITTVHIGVSEVFLKNDNIINKRDNTKPYFLYVGARNYNYKNFDFLLNNFIEKKYFLNFNLILVGGEKDLTIGQKEKIDKTGRKDWIHQEFCSDERLAYLYSNAKVFVYPSLYEGFGIPLLEAMACGCPVLASNVSSIPEVVGEAGLLFDIKDKNDFIYKLEKILNDKELSFELISKGKIRARQFTWENSVDRVYQEYLKFDIIN